MNANDKARALVKGVSNLLQCRKIIVGDREICARHSSHWSTDGCQYALNMAHTEAVALEAQGWDIIKADPYECYRCNCVLPDADVFIQHLRNEHA